MYVYIYRIYLHTYVWQTAPSQSSVFSVRSPVHREKCPSMQQKRVRWGDDVTAWLTLSNPIRTCGELSTVNRRVERVSGIFIIIILIIIKWEMIFLQLWHQYSFTSLLLLLWKSNLFRHKIKVKMLHSPPNLICIKKWCINKEFYYCYSVHGRGCPHTFGHIVFSSDTHHC